MTAIIKRYLKYKPLWILFIVFLLVYSWFHRGKLFAGGEGAIPFYNLELTYDLYSSAWRESQGGIANIEKITVMPYFYLLKQLYSIGISGVFLQAATFFILMATGSISVYFLLLETIGKELKISKDRSLAPFFGSLFYLLNPFSMMQVWGRGLYMQFFPFGLLPLLLLLFVMALKRRRYIYLVIALLSTFIFSGAFLNLSYFISFGVLLGLYIIYYLYENKEKKNVYFVILTALFLLIGFVLVNYWWIFYDFKSLSSLTVSRSAGLEHNLGTLRGVSRNTPFWVVIRLLHNFLLKDKIYGEVYFNPFFVLISFLIPISFIFSITLFKKTKHFKYFFSLFILTLFFVLGSNPPLGFLFEYLFNKIYFLQSLRNPYEKMGIVFTIAYAPFFSIGILNLSKVIKERLRIGIVSRRFLSHGLLFLVVGVYAWPMWTGHFAGGFKINPWIKVPEYYQEANDWLVSQKGEFKILHMPLNSGDGLRYLWQEGTYQGTDPSEYLFSNHSISKNIAYNKSFYTVLLERFGALQDNVYGSDPEISRSKFKSKHFFEELQRLDVEYIVLHDDLDTTLGNFNKPEDVKNTLKKEENIEKVKEFGKLSIYRVVKAEDKDLIFSPEVEVKVTKNTSTNYKFSMKNNERSTSVNFLNNYHSGWMLYKNGQEIKEHAKVYSYANSWQISKPAEGEYVLKYKPQDYVDKGWIVSKVAVMILSGFVILHILGLKTRIV